MEADVVNGTVMIDGSAFPLQEQEMEKESFGETIPILSSRNDNLLTPHPISANRDCPTSHSSITNKDKVTEVNLVFFKLQLLFFTAGILYTLAKDSRHVWCLFGVNID